MIDKNDYINLMLEKNPKLNVSRPEVDYPEQIVFDLYGRVINPMNQNIDWHGFFIWSQIKDVENIEETADLMMLMRNHYSTLEKSRDKKKKQIESEQKVHNDLLKKKFGG